MNAAKARMEGQTEVALLQRVAGGDRDAFAELYRRLQRPLFGYLMKLVREREMVEDVLNETLMEVWRQAARFEGRSSVNTWVFSIAHHRAVSKLRKKRETALDEEQAAAIEDEGPTPDVKAVKSRLNLPPREDAEPSPATAALAPAGPDLALFPSSPSPWRP